MKTVLIVGLLILAYLVVSAIDYDVMMSEVNCPGAWSAGQSDFKPWKVECEE